VLKDLVTVTGLRFVNVDVERRRRRDVVWSIREELVWNEWILGSSEMGDYMARCFCITVYIASARVRCGGPRLRGMHDVTIALPHDVRGDCLFGTLVSPVEP